MNRYQMPNNNTTTTTTNDEAVNPASAWFKMVGEDAARCDWLGCNKHATALSVVVLAGYADVRPLCQRHADINEWDWFGKTISVV